MRFRAFLGYALVLTACWSPDPPAAQSRGRAAAAAPVSLAGTYRAVLASPGGELPFRLEISPGNPPRAIARNGEERVPFSNVSQVGRSVTLEIAGYDSRIEAVASEDGHTLTGTWSKTAASGTSRLSFTAARGKTHRFYPAPNARNESVAGVWATTFTEDDGSTFPARAEFRQNGALVQGTFLTETGDYRYLEGELHDGVLSLSCFDGGHAFLFRAALADGQLEGDFWSRDSYHARWRATPLEPGADDGLSDPFASVKLDNAAGMFQFAFPDVDGNVVSSEDARFAGKVVVVDIFGTWCPNCNDQAPLLATWHKRYGPRGLELVGLAFEFTGDPGRDRTFVRRYAQRHGLEFPLLLAGVSDKKEAAAALPNLPELAAYPTTIFIGRDGRVAAIHSGFSGPATGEHHEILVAKLEAQIEALLAAPEPPN